MKTTNPILWLTGLSGSGKTTLAWAIAGELCALRVHFSILDGDELRQTLCAGLGFIKADRDENIRRIGALAHETARAGRWAIVAAISPYRAIRNEIRASCEAEGLRFIEIQLQCPMATLELRDPKGLYRRARAGELAYFTGISDPYEPAENPEILVRTNTSLAESVAGVMVRIGGLV